MSSLSYTTPLVERKKYLLQLLKIMLVCMFADQRFTAMFT